MLPTPDFEQNYLKTCIILVIDERMKAFDKLYNFRVG